LILLSFLILIDLIYLNNPRSFKSLKVVKNIKDINKNIPIRKKPSWVFCDKGLPKTFSKA
jgi:hypothetical protein